MADVDEVARAIGTAGQGAQGRALAEWSAGRLSPARRSESEARQPAWLGVDLRHLVAFRAISETGSFVKAARSLGYTQPAISHQVATLERIVGHRLFERSSGPGTAELTAAGNAFAGHAAAAIANLDCARAELNALDAGERGTLRVGSFQSVSAPILPRVVGNMRLERRPIALELTESLNEEELIAGLIRGELDFAFALLPVEQESIAAAELLSDPYYLASSSNRRYRIDIDSLSELADTPIVARRSCKSWTNIEALLRAEGINPKYAIRTDDILALKEFVQGGVGVAFVSHLTLELMGDGLETRSIEDLVPPRRIAVMWSRHRNLGPHEQAFLSVTQEVCKALITSSRHG